LNRLGGGCQVPIGAIADLRGQIIFLNGIVAHPDGTKVVRQSQEGENPICLGEAVADALLENGAGAILAEVYGGEAVPPQQP